MKSALLLAVPLLLVLFAGCGTDNGGVGKEDAGKAKTLDPGAAASGAATTPVSSASGTAVGAAFAEADLEPSGGSGAGGTALFKGVGSLGVQVDLRISRLPSGDAGATYYAQVHEGSCSDGRADGNGAGVGPALALVRFGGLLAQEHDHEHEHGGKEHVVPEEPPGSIEQPVGLTSSADGSASASALLEDVQKKRLTSGGPKYVDLHSAESEDAPVLACGVLKERR
jgi:hypothetical protein